MNSAEHITSVAPAAIAESDYGSPTFRKVSDMESPLVDLENLCHAALLISVERNEQEDGVISSLLGMALGKCREVEAIRGDLFRLDHPSRDHFENVDRPGAAAEDAVDGKAVQQ